jgi:hypothetical protein
MKKVEKVDVTAFDLYIDERGSNFNVFIINFIRSKDIFLVKSLCTY